MTDRGGSRFPALVRGAPGSRSEAAPVAFQLHCPGCAAPVEITAHGARRGVESCVYCGDPVALPAELATSPPAPRKRPEHTPIVVERAGPELRVAIPSRGAAAAARRLNTFLFLLVCEVGALAVAWQIHPAFFAPAAFLLPALAFVARETVSGSSGRFFEVTDARVACVVTGPYAWMVGKRRMVHAVPFERFGGIAERVIEASATGETRALLVDLGGGHVRVFAVSPHHESEDELRWLGQEVQAYLDERSGSAAATARAERGIVEVGFALSCMRCNAALEPSPADAVRGSIECQHCKTQSVLAPRIRGMLGVDEDHRHRTRHKRSPIEIQLGGDRMEVSIPPRGWTPMVLGQGLGFGCLVGAAMSAAVALVLVGSITLALVSAGLGLLMAIPLSRTLFQVYGTTRLVIEPKTTQCERGWLTRRRFEAPTSRIRARYVRPGATEGDFAIVHQLRLEIDGGASVVLGHGQFGDEWTWLASEINAFQASVARG